METMLTKDQKKTFTKYYVEDGQEYEITATARYDDQCGNGHNSFSLTAEIWATKNKRRTRRDCESCGCLHEEIAKHFPELAPFIKWHLVSSDEPLHYLANTLYHFSDKDHNGLRKGEKKQLRNGKTGLPVWERKIFNEKGEEVKIHATDWKDSETRPEEKLTASWEPVWIEGEGKKREIDHAKSSCIWGVAPDDTKNIFEDMSEKKLEAYLKERAPHVQMAFKNAMEELGFTF